MTTTPTDSLFLPPVRTPAEIPALFAELRRSWRDRFKEEPRADSVLVLLAQWGVETGDGRSCWNFNLGNVKRIAGDHWTWLSNVPEILSSVPAGATRSVQLAEGKFKCFFNPPHPQTHFRAFESLAAGADAFIAFLHEKYASAWPHVLAADPVAFARELKRKHYFTAEVEGPDGYAAVLKGRMAAFRRQLRPAPLAFDLKTAAGQSAVLELLGFTGDCALTAFQESQGIRPTGPFGPKTRAAVTKLLLAYNRDREP